MDIRRMEIEVDVADNYAPVMMFTWYRDGGKCRAYKVHDDGEFEHLATTTVGCVAEQFYSRVNTYVSEWEKGSRFMEFWRDSRDERADS